MTDTSRLVIKPCIVIYIDTFITIYAQRDRDYDFSLHFASHYTVIFITIHKMMYGNKYTCAYFIVLILLYTHILLSFVTLHADIYFMLLLLLLLMLNNVCASVRTCFQCICFHLYSYILACVYFILI